MHITENFEYHHQKRVENLAKIVGEKAKKGERLTSDEKEQFRILGMYHVPAHYTVYESSAPEDFGFSEESNYLRPKDDVYSLVTDGKCWFVTDWNKPVEVETFEGRKWLYDTYRYAEKIKQGELLNEEDLGNVIKAFASVSFTWVDGVEAFLLDVHKDQYIMENIYGEYTQPRPLTRSERTFVEVCDIYA